MILVAGASGLLGSNFAEEALRAGNEVVTICHRFPVALPGVVSVQANLTEPESVDSLFRRFKPKWVINCAAMANVDGCQQDPVAAHLVNAELPRLLARCAHRADTRMVQISTDAVFDGEDGDYDEEAPVNPVNIYAQSKVAGEAAVKDEMEEALIVRTNIYGWNMQPKQSFAEWIIGRLREGKRVPGFVDAIFTPLLVNDLSVILLEMMDRDLRGLYHVASCDSLSKYEFARMLATLFGYDRALIERGSLEAASFCAPRPRNTSLLTKKVTDALAHSMPKVEDGLRRFRQIGETGIAKRFQEIRRGQCRR